MRWGAAVGGGACSSAATRNEAASPGGRAGGDNVEAGGEAGSIERARALAAVSVGTEAARPGCGPALLRVGSPSRPSAIAIRSHDAKSPAKASPAQRGRSFASREAPLSPHARVV